MYTVTKSFEFCYGHRLLDYPGKCRHPHGHNGRIEIELAREGLDGLGMVIDFFEIKRVLEHWVEENLDHRMVLRRDDPLAAVLREMGEPVFLMDGNPTAENIAKLVYEEAQRQGLPVFEVRLWETGTACAGYRGEGVRQG